MFYVLLTLCFLPSVTFGLLESEIFPWALLFALVYTRFTSDPSLLHTTVMIVLLLLSSVMTAVGESGNTDVLRSLTAYFNCISIFICILSLSYRRIEKILGFSRILFIALLVLGIAQYFALTSPLQPIISLLVPRASGAPLYSDGGRGVTLLASEPARAGVELALLYIMYRLTSGKKSQLVLVDVAFLLFTALVIRSATALAFGVFAVILLTTQSKWQLVSWVPILPLIPLVGFSQSSGRALELIGQMDWSGNPSQNLLLLANESGHRYVALCSFVLSGVQNLIGSGVGAWKTASVQAIISSGFDATSFRYFQIVGGGYVIPVRGPGVLSNMMLDIGLLGTLYFCYWVMRVTKQYRTSDVNSRIIMTILFVKIALFGSVGEPIPWIVTAVLLRWQMESHRLGRVPTKVLLQKRTALRSRKRAAPGFMSPAGLSPVGRGGS